MAEVEGSSSTWFQWPEGGVRYEVDDHVYVSPPYSKRAGEPWLVGRILEISRPKVGDGPRAQPRVKLAFYLRPRDISSRYIADHRVLLATMHADDSPISYIRGKCRVHHRERLPYDLETYKREPDSFYYHQLYDRYLHRYFDLIPTERVQNAPPDALAYLNEHFEFVCCEVGMGHELSDALRGCTECHKWAANAESVNCAVCKKIWHLQCVEPPLSKKPPAGYAWSCAPCSARHEEDLERYMASGDASLKPPTLADRKAASTQKPSKGKEPATTPSSSVGKLKQTNGWPFRYFGQHSDPTTITDPHDSFYPRASTRVGHKFQMSAIYLDGEADPADRVRRKGNTTVGVKRDRHGQPKSTEGMSRAKIKRLEKEEMRSNHIHTRGGEQTVETISIPFNTEQEAQLDVLIQAAQKTSVYRKAGVNYLNEALLVFCKALSKSEDISTAQAKALALKLRDVGVADWSEAEVEKFNEGIMEHQDDLEEVAQTLPKKTVGDVVNYYYQHRVDMESQLDQQHDDDKWADGVAPTGLDSNAAALDDDNESIAEPPDDHEPLGPCAICETAEATMWYKCPHGIGTAQYTGANKVMCPECSIQWRHYASDTPFVVEDLAAKKAAAKAARAAAKLLKVEEEQVPEVEKVPERPPLPPKPVAVPRACIICKKFEPKVSLATCSRCCLSGHFDCCGLDSNGYDEKWLCPMCKVWNKLQRAHPVSYCLFFKRTTDYVKHAHCAICPPRRLKGPSDNLSALDFFKPTVDNGFVHMICAILHPELTFQDTHLMQPVEGVVAMPMTKWSKECFVCNQSDAGACVKCADCSKHFHVSCAWQAGYKFAFEIQPVKKKKQTQGISVRFQSESGAMDAKIWCRSHKLRAGRIVYDFAAMDTNLELNALQVFVRNFKSLRSGDSFPLLRRGLRLDNLLAPALLPEKPASSPLTAVSAIVALDMPIMAATGRSRTSKSASSSPTVVKARSVPVRAKAKPKPKAKSPPVRNGKRSLKVKLQVPATPAPSPPRWEYDDAVPDSVEEPVLDADLELVNVPEPVIEAVPLTPLVNGIVAHHPKPVEDPAPADEPMPLDDLAPIDEPAPIDDPAPTEITPVIEPEIEPTPEIDPALLVDAVGEVLPAEPADGDGDAPEQSAPLQDGAAKENSYSNGIDDAPEQPATDASHAPSAPQPPDEDPPPPEDSKEEDEEGDEEEESSEEEEAEESVSEFEEQPDADRSEDDDYIEEETRRSRKKRKVDAKPPARNAQASTSRSNQPPKPARALPASQSAGPGQAYAAPQHAPQAASGYAPQHVMQPATPADIEYAAQMAAYQAQASSSQHESPHHSQPHSREASSSYAQSMQSMPPQPSPQYQHPDPNSPGWQAGPQDMHAQAAQYYYGAGGPPNGYYGAQQPAPYQHMPDGQYYGPPPAHYHDGNYGYPSPAQYEQAMQMANGPVRLTKAGSARRRRSPIPADAVCFNCNTAQTPVWRRDDQHHVLCNSCGQYWKAHGKHRPVNLKGPKRTINKYAPQGQPPPGALIKNSALDKELNRERLAQMAALSGSPLPSPSPPTTGSSRRSREQRTHSLPPSQPATPVYGEAGLASPFAPQSKKAPTHAAHEHYMPPYSQPPYNSGFAMPHSPASYYHHAYPPTSHSPQQPSHSPQQPSDIAVDSPYARHAPHQMSPYQPQAEGAAHHARYHSGHSGHSGGYPASPVAGHGEAPAEPVDVDPALIALGAAPAHGGHHEQHPADYNQLQQWGHQFAAAGLPPSAEEQQNFE